MTSANNTDTLDGIRTSLASVLKLSPSERDAINLETTPLQFAAWTSMVHLELVLDLERRFHVTFDADEIASLASVKSIVEALSRRRG